MSFIFRSLIVGAALATVASGCRDRGGGAGVKEVPGGVIEAGSTPAKATTMNAIAVPTNEASLASLLATLRTAAPTPLNERMNVRIRDEC